MSDTYDNVTWHWADWPEGKPLDYAYTHMAALVYWAILRDHLNPEAIDQELADSIRAKQTLPVCFLEDYCDGKLLDDEFTEETNQFLGEYYYGTYIEDFVALFDNDEDYDIPNTWDTYDKVVPMLDQAYASWKQAFQPVPDDDTEAIFTFLGVDVPDAQAGLSRDDIVAGLTRQATIQNQMEPKPD